MGRELHTQAPTAESSPRPQCSSEQREPWSSSISSTTTTGEEEFHTQVTPPTESSDQCSSSEVSHRRAQQQGSLACCSRAWTRITQNIQSLASMSTPHASITPSARTPSGCCLSCLWVSSLSIASSYR